MITTELDTLRLVLASKNETIDGLIAVMSQQRADIEAERKRSARWKYAAKRFLHRAQMCRGLWEADDDARRAMAVLDAIAVANETIRLKTSEEGKR